MNTRNHWEVSSAVTNTVHDLWKNAVEYFKWCDANPMRFKRTVIAGKEVGRKVEVEKVRPYSLKALCLHCGVTEDYIKDLMKSPKDSEAYLIAGRILTNIFVQIYELGLVGEISPVLAAKLLNLDVADEGPQKVVIEHVSDLPKLSTSENDILEQLEIQDGKVKFPESNLGKEEDLSGTTQ